MSNPFVHIELSTSDVQAAQAFYKSLFGWGLRDEDVGGGMMYTMIDVGGGTGGGMMRQMMLGAPSAWMPYVGVEDIRAATEKARSLGATVLRDVMDVMESGSLSILRDPTGALFGLWQTKSRA